MYAAGCRAHGGHGRCARSMMVPLRGADPPVRHERCIALALLRCIRSNSAAWVRHMSGPSPGDVRSAESAGCQLGSDTVDTIRWLARQPLDRVALLGAAWAVGLPVAAFLAFHLVMWYIAWRHDGIAYRVHLNWPGVMLILLVPPVVLLLAWWAVRRAH